MKRITPFLAVLALAGCGTDVTGPSSSLLSCVFGEAVTPSPGQVLQFQGVANQGVCLDGGPGAEFVYVPFNAATATVSLDLTGAGFADAGLIGQSRAGLVPRISLGAAAQASRYVMDYEFHDRLRRSEITELEPRIRPGPVTARAAAPPLAADTPSVGELRDFNVAVSCDGTDIRTGEVMYLSQHAVVMADTANPADLTSTDYAYFGETFDTLIHRVETAHFGDPTDIDDNGRSILFFTRAVNERNPQGSETVTIGFFWSGDLFPPAGSQRLQACPASNESEMFYLIAPDPNGDAGVAFTLETVRNLAIPLIGHEFQHLINASRRLFVNNATTFEEGWLNEGLSHAAEELLFLDVAGFSTGSNLDIDDVRNADAVDAFNQYMGGNFNNYARYLQRPDTASLMGEANLLSSRGAAWAFLRYAADRSGRGDETFYFDVVNAPDAGLDNLDGVLGEPATDWIRDWAVSIYTDDLVSGITPRFTASSWNWRSVYEGSSMEAYPLRVESLVSGETATASLLSGGAIFNRFGVAPEGRAVLHVETASGQPASSLHGSFIRVR